jgi:hypothetical protein
MVATAMVSAARLSETDGSRLEKMDAPASRYPKVRPNTMTKIKNDRAKLRSESERSDIRSPSGE